MPWFCRNKQSAQNCNVPRGARARWVCVGGFKYSGLHKHTYFLPNVARQFVVCMAVCVYTSVWWAMNRNIIQCFFFNDCTRRISRPGPSLDWLARGVHQCGLDWVWNRYWFFSDYISPQVLLVLDSYLLEQLRQNSLAVHCLFKVG